ncbi:MAG: ROK family transcriptional regulator [Lachnospiraceae bacterium]|nr:ROK family transcriptional regulator [Lachnospiraceae bacterium]
MFETKVTSYEMKKINRSKVYQYIYSNHHSSRPEISYALQMSFPTVTQNLTALEDCGLITKNGFSESTGGRKAQRVSCNPTAKIAIGVELLKESVLIAAVDLYGTVLKDSSVDLPFSNSPDYFQRVCNQINNFIATLSFPVSQILGIGIAMQGLVSEDGQTMIYGKILQCTGLKIDNFSQYLDLPCIFIHDAKASASAELWFLKDVSNAIYLSLNRNLGGAVILNGEVQSENGSISGTFEHICINPSGDLCYCGKRGCLETYCSAYSLCNASGESIDRFFELLGQKDSRIQGIWENYLRYLAIAITNIRHVMDYDFIIGGLLSTYFREEDYQYLSALLEENSSIQIKTLRLIPGKCGKQVTAIGAALHYIVPFLKSI